MSYEMMDISKQYKRDTRITLIFTKNYIRLSYEIRRQLEAKEVERFFVLYDRKESNVLIRPAENSDHQSYSLRTGQFNLAAFMKRFNLSLLNPIYERIYMPGFYDEKLKGYVFNISGILVAS